MPLERLLILNGAGAGDGLTNLIAAVEGGKVVAQRRLPGRGASERFAPELRAVLHEAGWHGAGRRGADGVAAVVGPGSFTGLRAALSLAMGLAAGWNCPSFGVTLGAAIRATLGREDVTCVSIARRGRFFVDPPEGPVFAVQAEALALPAGAAVAGDAVPLLRGEALDLLDQAAPDALGLAKAASRGTPRPLVPLYIDPPEAKPPAAGLRPAPL